MSNILQKPLLLSLKNQLESFEEDFIRVHEEAEKVTSIRINPRKLIKPEADNTSGVPWCSNGFYLNERPVFTLDPLFHAGTYYVQEASSMFTWHIVQQLKLDENPITALDLCAAPGGKSTLLASVLHPDSLLISNEIIKPRASVLVGNLSRWGNANSIVTNNDPKVFGGWQGQVDLLLADAPCSGSGMFRKDPDTIDEWSEQNVELCAQRQQRILADSLPVLKEGGYLIYSTCSYSEKENEEILDWLMDSHALESVRITKDPDWGIIESQSLRHHAYGYRFYPHLVKGEGFFVAVLRKTGAERQHFKRRSGRAKLERHQAI